MMTEVKVTNPTPVTTRIDVWDRVCRHVDGLSVGSTVAALGEHGILPFLAERGTASVGEVRGRFGGNPGPLHVAIRLLADQGWLRLAGESGTDNLEATVTRPGTVAFQQARSYRQATRFARCGQRVDALFRNGSSGHADAQELADAVGAVRGEWGVARDLRPLSVRHQVLAHLDGHVLGPVMGTLTRYDVFDVDRIRWPEPIRRSPGVHFLFDLLAREGWTEGAPDDGRLTDAGRIAAVCAPQYWYPLSYVPMLGGVADLLFGQPGQSESAPVPGDGEAEETHVDRKLDIQFSGEVFSGPCREAFLELALPLFDRALEDQPDCVIDTGCGDGTVLAELYQAIRNHTVRGKRLRERPLVMIGAEPSPVAREAAAARLAGAGIPHMMVNGDITDPDELTRRLSAAGIDARGALHISKSVLHNRRIRVPADESGTDPVPTFSGAYAAPDGSSLTPAEVAHDLAGLFRLWHPLIHRHGMIVVEAHTVDPELTAELQGRTIHTALDATHGYSCQYPIVPSAYAWAARAGDLTTLAHREIGRKSYGHTVLTVDHFVPA